MLIHIYRNNVLLVEHKSRY